MNAAVKSAELAEKKHDAPARARAYAFASAPAQVLTTPLAWQFRASIREGLEQRTRPLGRIGARVGEEPQRPGLHSRA